MSANVSSEQQIDDTGFIKTVTQRPNNQQSVIIYHWPVLSLSFFAIIGIIGNLLVCIAITTERRLQNRTNWFLFSLALADMLVSGVVIPLAIVKEFTGLIHFLLAFLSFCKTKTQMTRFIYSISGFWIFGPVICDIWIFVDVCSCTSSIIHIVVISIDRYLAIKHPFNARSRQEKYHICPLIMLIWFIAIILSFPIIVLGVINPQNIIMNRHCFINNTFFVIYGSVVSFVIPLIIVIIMYALTVHRLQRQIKKCQDQFKQEQTVNKTNSIEEPFLRRQVGNNILSNISSHTKLITATELRRKRFQKQNHCLQLSEESINFYLPNENNQVKSTTHNEYSCTKNPFLKLKSSSDYQQIENIDTHKSIKFNCFPCCLNKKTNLSNETTNSTKMSSQILSRTISKHQLSLIKLNPLKRNLSRLTLIPSLSIRRSKSTAVRTERKAVKVLGVVFAIFVLAWFPFCITNLLHAVCKHCKINENLLNSFVWLGYVSSSINPLVYTIFNKNFRLKFIALLKCQCLYRRNELTYYQNDLLLNRTRVQRTNELMQHDIQRFNAHRQHNNTI